MLSSGSLACLVSHSPCSWKRATVLVGNSTPSGRAPPPRMEQEVCYAVLAIALTGKKGAAWRGMTVGFGMRGRAKLLENGRDSPKDCT